MVECLYTEYERVTGLQRHDFSITPDMHQYHAFLKIHPETPGAIIELGFMSADRRILEDEPGRLARGIDSGSLRPSLHLPHSVLDRHTEHVPKAPYRFQVAVCFLGPVQLAPDKAHMGLDQIARFAVNSNIAPDFSQEFAMVHHAFCIEGQVLEQAELDRRKWYPLGGEDHLFARRIDGQLAHSNELAGGMKCTLQPGDKHFNATQNTLVP